jgi:hypothetical protein
MNSHDPDFVTKVHMIYKFEELQPLKFELYDVDSKSQNLRDHEFLGWATCNLAQIIRNGKVGLKLFVFINQSVKKSISISPWCQGRATSNSKSKVFCQYSGAP